MLVDLLRELTDLHHSSRQEQPISDELELRQLFHDAFEQMKRSATEGRREAVLLTIQDYKSQWIDLYYGGEADPDPGLVMSEGHRQFLRHVGVDRLRGAAGLLRDKLTNEGLHLTLFHRVEGNTHNSRHNVYTLVATW